MRNNSPFIGLVWGMLVVLVIVAFSLGYRLSKTTAKYDTETKVRLLKEAELYETKKILVEKEITLQQREQELALRDQHVERLNTELEAAQEVKQELERQIAIALGLGPKGFDD